MALSRDDTSGGNRATLRFVYDDPPGIDNKKEEGRVAADHEHKSEYDNGGENKSSEEQGDDSLSFERKVGDE